MSVQSFIGQKSYLVWYARDFAHLSHEAALEAVLNYGDFDDVKKFIALVGRKKAARMFRKQARQRRTNYDPKIMNYFRLYFKKYA